MTVTFTIIANVQCDENGVKLVDNLRSFSAKDEVFIADCRRRAELDAAIKQHEAERLIELLTGEPIKRRKRCEACHGCGRANERLTHNGIGSVFAFDECNKCHGTGYKEGEGDKQNDAIKLQ